MNQQRLIDPQKMVLFFVLVLFLINGCQNKNKWAGEIRYEDGIEIIKNPNTPLNKRAGRIISLKEEFRVTDKNGEFFFRNPQCLKTASDGSIFISDRNRLFKFSEEGKFLKNLLRIGQGPGELHGLLRFTIFEDEIYICDGQSKNICMDLEGEIIGEFGGESYHIFDDISRHWLIDCSTFDLPLPQEQTYKLADCIYHITFIPRNGDGEEKSIDVKAKMFVGPRVFMKWDELLWAFDKSNEFVFVSHSREYQIEVLDLNAGRITRRFSRDYPRVKYNMKESERTLYSRYNPPEKKYESDIGSMHYIEGFIWAKTSLMDKEKGTLIDVFDVKGRYINNFYIDLKGEIMSATDDIIFVKEMDELGNIQIVKYKLNP